VPTESDAELVSAHGPTLPVLLEQYESMCRAVAEVVRIDEARDFHAKAAALADYHKRARNRDAEVLFSEVRVRAERKVGELLGVLAGAGGRAKQGRPPKGNTLLPLTLEELGVEKIESSRYQAIANIPEKAFESALWKARLLKKPVSSAALRMLGRPKLQRSTWDYKTPEELATEQRAKEERDFRRVVMGILGPPGGGPRINIASSRTKENLARLLVAADLADLVDNELIECVDRVAAERASA
jgi:hypothetical protein